MSTTTAEAEAPETTGGDGPLLDLTDAAVKKFIKQAKARGYVTMDELNKVLPSEEVTSEAIEDTLAMLSEMGVNVVEAEEDAEGGGEVAVREESAVSRPPRKPPRPHRRSRRMYLREMGSVGCCPARQSPSPSASSRPRHHDPGPVRSALTFEAIMVWREELGSGRILLREVIDLEQTYGGRTPRAEELPPMRRRRAEEEGSRSRRGQAKGDDDDFDDGAGPTSAPWKASCAKA